MAKRAVTDTPATATAPTSPAPAAAQGPLIQSEPQKLRIAFIGAGGIAGAHMKYLAPMPDVEIVALADINAAGMQKHAQLYNVPADCCFTDYQEMLAKIQPAAVSICTPNALHAPTTIAALEAGADVLVEKPMAMNVVNAQRMVDAAKKHGRKLVIGFQYRFAQKSQWLRAAIEGKMFGDILFARCQALRRRGIPNWGVFGRKELQGGGPLIDIGVHILEVAHYVMGSPKPVSASGNIFTYLGNQRSETACQWPNWDYKSYNVEDLGVGQVRFENGAVLHLEASFAAHIEKDVWGFQVMGTKAGATWDPPVMFHDVNGYMVNTTPGYLPSDGFGEHFERKMRNFVDHVLHDKPTLAPAEHGLMVQKMLDGIYLSAAEGREVKLD